MACPYTPTDSDSPQELADRAFACGLELHPDDKRSLWVVEEDLIDIYHAGQAERYATEEW